MHENYITRRCSILKDLELYSIDLFSTFLKASDSHFGITGGA